MRAEESSRGRGGIRGVAKEAGVSITTVSQVLNGKGSFSEATKARVHHAVRKLGYRPHPAARSLAGVRTQVIALAFSHRIGMPYPLTHVDYFSKAIASATESALSRDHSLVVGPPTPQTDIWFRLPLDGVVLFDPVRGDPVPGLLRQRSTPMVVVGRDPNGDFDDPCVDNDPAVATRLALDHLWGSGARRPAFVTFPLNDAFVSAAEATYRAWCTDHAIDPIVWTISSLWERPSRTALAGHIARSDHVDGILALEDTLGIEAVNAAEDLHLRVPEDIKVIAFCDREAFPGVPISSVLLDPATTAHVAVNMLVDLIEDGELANPRVEIPVRLVPRRSTGW